MNEAMRLYKSVAWLDNADTDSPSSILAGASESFQSRFLSPSSLGKLALSYFQTCVPEDSYSCVAGEHWYRIYCAETLDEDLIDSSYSEVVVKHGFVPVGRAWDGSPLLIDLSDGRLHHFHAEFLHGETLVKPAPTKGWKRVPASRDSIIEWSDTTWGNILDFFCIALEDTKAMFQEGVWDDIAGQDCEQLHHFRSLGLPFGATNAEGRTPLELARETGNREVIEIVEAILREHS